MIDPKDNPDNPEPENELETSSSNIDEGTEDSYPDFEDDGAYADDPIDFH